jgi:glutamate 5-kinase
MNNTLVVKIEIDTLFDDHGKLDPKKMDRLAMVVSNLNNSGKKVIIVSSGAIALGMEKLGMKNMPGSLIELQATAAVGQAELIKTYQRYLGEYNQIVAQVLITNDIVNYPERHSNAAVTFSRLIDMGIIPVVNENDVVSTDDIVMEDNYPIAYMIANLAKASGILIKSKENGHYFFIHRADNKLYSIGENQIYSVVEEFSRRDIEEMKRGKFPVDFKTLPVVKLDNN